MWILLFSLFYIQQPVHTEVRVETREYKGFTTEEDCKRAGKTLNEAYSNVAVEPRDDTDDSDKKDDQFPLVRPVTACIGIK